jgi:hypothetical protein
VVLEAHPVFLEALGVPLVLLVQEAHPAFPQAPAVLLVLLVLVFRLVQPVPVLPPVLLVLEAHPAFRRVPAALPVLLVLEVRLVLPVPLFLPVLAVLLALVVPGVREVRAAREVRCNSGHAGCRWCMAGGYRPSLGKRWL